MAYRTQVDSVYLFLMLWLFVRPGFPLDSHSDLLMLQPRPGSFRRKLRLLDLIPQRSCHCSIDLILSGNSLFKEVS